MLKPNWPLLVIEVLAYIEDQLLGAKNKLCERFVTVHDILQSRGRGGNEQGMGDFAGLASNALWSAACVAIYSSSEVVWLFKTDERLLSDASKKNSALPPFSSAASQCFADDVRLPPLTVFTDAPKRQNR